MQDASSAGRRSATERGPEPSAGDREGELRGSTWESELDSTRVARRNRVPIGLRCDELRTTLQADAAFLVPFHGDHRLTRPGCAGSPRSGPSDRARARSVRPPGGRDPLGCKHRVQPRGERSHRGGRGHRDRTMCDLRPAIEDAGPPRSTGVDRGFSAQHRRARDRVCGWQRDASRSAPFVTRPAAGLAHRAPFGATPTRSLVGLHGCPGTASRDVPR